MRIMAFLFGGFIAQQDSLPNDVRLIIAAISATMFMLADIASLYKERYE